jgi:transposase
VFFFINLTSVLDKDVIIEMQSKQIAVLLSQMEVLTARVLELENNQKKDSNNSSKPPSTDIGKVRKTRSLRIPGDKSHGGQAGHKGDTLKSVSNPDIIEVHHVANCTCCGKELGVVELAGYKSRQVFDLPPIQLPVTEHRVETKQCPDCATLSTASFPTGVSQSVQYGKGIQKLAVYLSNYQLLPYQRTAELFEDLLGHRINEASLVSMNQRFAANADGFIEQLKECLSDQAVLHADETGYYYKSKRNWLHVLATEKHTLYMPHAKRGTEAMDAMGILPGYKGRLIHDFWKSYNEYECAHGLCNVHHLRDLTFCSEIEKSPWAAQMKQFLSDLQGQVSQAKKDNATALSPDHIRSWQDKYDHLLKAGWEAHPPPAKQQGKRGAVKKTKTQNLLQRFGEYKESILAFACDFNIPFGNNLAEQAIRMMKIKQKISGCFRTEQGAIQFAIIRSYISTMKKQGKNIFIALDELLSGNRIVLA